MNISDFQESLDYKSNISNTYSVGAIKVPLAILWSDTTPKRTHDNFILGSNTDPDSWINGMTDSMRLWLVGKVETNAIFGERVVILKRKGNWLKVAAIDQHTSKNPMGYPGWIPAVQVSTNPVYLTDQTNSPQAVVVVPMAELYDADDFNKLICKLSYQTKLPILLEHIDSFLVRLPDGNIGHLLKTQATKFDELISSSKNVVEQARQFLGLKYLWGGTSAWGFDCSGLTFRMYQSQKISIPRDADEQFLEGVAVSEENLSPGDLVFFANSKGLIHHVGINISNGIMIHSPNSSSYVKEQPFNIGVYANEYFGARTY